MTRSAFLCVTFKHHKSFDKIHDCSFKVCVLVLTWAILTGEHFYRAGGLEVGHTVLTFHNWSSVLWPGHVALFLWWCVWCEFLVCPRLCRSCVTRARPASVGSNFISLPLSSGRLWPCLFLPLYYHPYSLSVSKGKGSLSKEKTFPVPFLIKHIGRDNLILCSCPR